MIGKEDVLQVLRVYDLDKITIATLGSHSALDIARGAKDEQLKSLVVCKGGREKTYSAYNKSRTRKIKTKWGGHQEYDVGCVDDVILVNNWEEMVSEKVLELLRKHNTILIPHRSLEVYLKYENINNKLLVPMFGNRILLQAEERTGPYKLEKNQDYLVKAAGIPTPKKFNSPDEIDRLVIVKATKAIGDRDFERQFPRVRSPEEYENILVKLLEGKSEQEKQIIESNFRSAPIEEFVSDKYVNLNFFYSAIHEELELLGTDTRAQFPAPSGDEFTHTPVSLRESLQEKAYDMGEKFVKITKKEYSPGIIGGFALQCVGDGKENLLVYDVSLRIPGSPDANATPYPWYLYGNLGMLWGYGMSFGRRIAREIKEAITADRLEEIVS